MSVSKPENAAAHPAHAPMALATTQARASRPRCGAFARSTGKPCQAEGSAIGGRCWLHCGATLPSGWRDPKPEWSLLVTADGVWLEPSRRARGRWPAERARFAARWPQRIRHWVGVRLIASGRIARAQLHRNQGEALIRAVKASGVNVLNDGGDALVRRVRFKVPDIEVSKQLAKCRGKGGANG